MQLRGRMRLAACLAPPLVALVAVGVVSCRESSGPTTRDDWAEQTVVSVQVRNEVTSYVGGNAQRVGSVPSQVSLPVFPDKPRRGPAFSRDGASRTVIHHFKDGGGKLHSIGAVDDGTGRPPKLIYAFEDGNIRSIISNVYQRHGKGWIRQRSRVTRFDDTGKPIVQLDIRPDLSGNTAPSLSAFNVAALGGVAADALRLFLPAPLHAEETGCGSEWLAYAAASFVVASATATLATLVASCVESGFGCGAIEKAVAVLTAAIAAWSVTLDNLVACREKNPTNSGGTPGGGGGGGGGNETTGGGGSDDLSSTNKTVQQFIDDAILRGNFSCSDDGDYCIYYLT